MKTLVFGKAGQLGFELARVFREHGHEVEAFGRDHVDVCDAARVEALIAQSDAEVVLNATAYNAVDLAESEPEAAYAGNALAVRNLAIACRQQGARLVHFSTDYVFDGSKGSPYVESDPTRPVGAYGVSKLAGEMYARAYVDDALVVRTSGVFGPAGARTPRGNFVETMLRLAGSGNPIRVIDYVASPTYAPDLADRTLELVEHKCIGVFHAGGGTPISWFEYARMIFDAAGVKPELRPTNEREYRTPARRPRYSALENARMREIGLTDMPPLRESVEKYLRARKG